MRLFGVRRLPAAVFNHEATIVNGEQTGVLCARDAGRVADAKLQPDGLRADGDRFVDVRVGLLGAAEDVDNVDRDGHGGEVGVGRFAEYGGGEAGVDGDDAEALLLEVSRDAVVVARGVLGQADDGDGTGEREDGVDVIQDGLIGGRGGVVLGDQGLLTRWGR